MNTFFLISIIALWLALLCVGFLLVGALRALGLISWRLEQLEAITPSHIGRDGLKLGKKAPHFTLPSAAGDEMSLHDFAGRKVLLVLTQSGCAPCREIVPELNRLHEKGEHQILVVNNAELEGTRRWAVEVGSRFPVLAQEKFSLSKRYQVFATPFAFLIDEQGVITSKGIVGTREYLGYVLTGAGQKARHEYRETDHDGAEKSETERTISSSKEVSHV